MSQQAWDEIKACIENVQTRLREEFTELQPIYDKGDRLCGLGFSAKSKTDGKDYRYAWRLTAEQAREAHNIVKSFDTCKRI